MQSVIRPGAKEDPAARWFEEARFGLFIHFSLASMFGEDLGYEAQRRVPYREYEAAVARFNPAAFDAARWVDVAASAGCRYITLTAKHVEGFCLWDTATTDFKITRTPFGRDIVAELAAECHARGMPLCLYVNPDDWHSRFKPNLPGNWGDRGWKRDDDEPDWEKHRAYIRQQLAEVLTNYGPIAGIWFDCTHLPEGHIQGRRLYEHIKGLQPGCLVNDRAKWGDFLTPEWDIAEHLDADRYLIEQCTSVAEDGWGWRRDFRYRSVPALVDLLVRTAGCGSNLLLNVAPDPTGAIPPPQAERMAAVGRWLKRNGEAIYGTRGVKLAGLGEGMRVTRRGHDVYLLLRRWPEGERITVGGMASQPGSARLLGGGELVCRLTEAGVVIDRLPAEPADAAAHVVHLRFRGEPDLVPAAAPVTVVHRIAVRPRGPTLLPVGLARLDGLAVKGWRHSVKRLRPSDAAYAQPPTVLPSCSDQPMDGGPAAGRPIEAIIDWRHVQESTHWTIEVPGAVRVRARLCLRCPKIVAGSRYEVRCGDRVLSATVQGNGPMEDRVRMDWYNGYAYLPFVWEEAGEMDLPAGIHELTLQPVENACGSNFADVIALELTPLGK
jgi:alpha-L-fucosidase